MTFNHHLKVRDVNMLFMLKNQHVCNGRPSTISELQGVQQGTLCSWLIYSPIQRQQRTCSAGPATRGLVL